MAEAISPTVPAAVLNLMGSGSPISDNLGGSQISVPSTPANALNDYINGTGIGAGQGALNADLTHKGNTYLVPPGVQYSALTTPVTSGSGYTCIRTSSLSLPSFGTRVSPSGTGAMFTVIGYGNGTGPAIDIPQGSNGWRFVGLQAIPENASFRFFNVRVRGNRVCIERSYSVPHPSANDHFRSIFLEGLSGGGGSDFQLWDSWIEGRAVQGDAQAFWTRSFDTSMQRLHIENCELRGSGENVMFGDASAVFHTQDATLKRNHLFKPLSWMKFLPNTTTPNPSFVPTTLANSSGSFEYSIKNIFEMKFSKRVLLEGNTLENCWVGNQNGEAVVINTGNRAVGAGLAYSGVNDDVEVTDFTFKNNLILNCDWMFTVNWVGPKDIHIPRLISFTNNLGREIRTGLLYTKHWNENIRAERCTAVPCAGPFYETYSGGLYLSRDGDVVSTDPFINHTVKRCVFGWGGATGTANGIKYIPESGSIDTDFTNTKRLAKFTSSTWLENAQFGGTSPSVTPAITRYASATTAGVNTTTGALEGGSPLIAAASDGGDIGVNHTTLNAALTGTVALPIPSFSYAQTPGTLMVVFTDTNTGGTATSWLWTGSDSMSSTSQNPSHTFTSAGTKSVTVTMTNAAGNASVTQSVVVADITTVAPSIVAVGASVDGTGALTVTWPTHITDDTGWLFVESANESVTTPSGWTLVTPSPQGLGTGGATLATRLTVFYKHATSAAEAAVSIPAIGDHAIAVIIVTRGVKKTGNPWDVTNGDTLTPASGTITYPAVTTTVANTRFLLAYATDISNPGSVDDWATGVSLTGSVRLFAQDTALGNDGAMFIGTGSKAAAGATGSMVTTQGTSGLQARMTIAMAPIPAAGNATLTATVTSYAFIGQTATLTALQSQTLTAVSLALQYLGYPATLTTLGTVVSSTLYPIRVKEFLPGRRASAVIRASVPPANQEEYVNPDYVSIHPLSTTEETNALRAGSIVEKLVTFPAKGVTTDPQFKALALAAQQAYQVEITAEVTSTFTGLLGYEGTYDGTTWA